MLITKTETLRIPNTPSPLIQTKRIKTGERNNSTLHAAIEQMPFRLMLAPRQEHKMRKTFEFQAKHLKTVRLEYDRKRPAAYGFNPKRSVFSTQHSVKPPLW